jgi:Fic family protein
MARTLKLNYSLEEGLTDFLEERLYVARTLIPSGYEPYFRKRAQYLSVQTSTRIEGNKLDDEQAMLVLVDDVQAMSRDEIEVKNLDEAYDLIQQIAGDPSVRVDEGLVRTMNSMILKGLPDVQARSRGKYRVGPSLIINQQTRAVRYRPPQPEWVPELMEEFFREVQAWVREKIYPGPVIAAMAHFGLISIHPFDDGNGRTARLLADMILHQMGWSNEGMLSASAAILSRQHDYYETLYQTQGESFRSEVDVTSFVGFHTSVLNAAAINLERSAVAFSRALDQFTRGVKGMLNSRQALALMFMLDVAPLSSSAYANLTGASQSAALSDLSQMGDHGLVQRVGRGRGTRYHVSPSIRREMEEAQAASETSEVRQTST